MRHVYLILSIAAGIALSGACAAPTHHVTAQRQQFEPGAAHTKEDLLAVKAERGLRRAILDMVRRTKEGGIASDMMLPGTATPVEWCWSLATSPTARQIARTMGTILPWVETRVREESAGRVSQLPAHAVVRMWERIERWASVDQAPFSRRSATERAAWRAIAEGARTMQAFGRAAIAAGDAVIAVTPDLALTVSRYLGVPL